MKNFSLTIKQVLAITITLIVILTSCKKSNNGFSDELAGNYVFSYQHYQTTRNGVITATGTETGSDSLHTLVLDGNGGYTYTYPQNASHATDANHGYRVAADSSFEVTTGTPFFTFISKGLSVANTLYKTNYYIQSSTLTIVYSWNDDDNGIGFDTTKFLRR